MPGMGGRGPPQNAQAQTVQRFLPCTLEDLYTGTKAIPLHSCLDDHYLARRAGVPTCLTKALMGACQFREKQENED